MKTVKVKIAVAIDCRGKWGASGWNEGNPTKSDIQSNAMEYLDSDEWEHVIHWIEADVPVPESETIQGEVVE